MNKNRELRTNKKVNNYECLLKRKLHCPDNGQELLSALGVTLAPVVQRLDNAIHRINRYPVDKC